MDRGKNDDIKRTSGKKWTKKRRNVSPISSSKGPLPPIRFLVIYVVDEDDNSTFMNTTSLVFFFPERGRIERLKRPGDSKTELNFHGARIFHAFTHACTRAH